MFVSNDAELFCLKQKLPIRFRFVEGRLIHESKLAEVQDAIKIVIEALTLLGHTLQIRNQQLTKESFALKSLDGLVFQRRGLTLSIFFTK